MSRNAIQLPSIPVYKQINLVLPGILVGELVFLALIVEGFRAGTGSTQGKIFWLFGVGGILYLSTVMVWVVPLLRKHPGFAWILALTSGLVSAAIEIYEPSLVPGVNLLLALAFTVILAVLSGRLPTYFYTFLALTANIVFFEVHSKESVESLFLDVALLPVIAVIITETILGLRRSLLTEMKRLQTLNRVARSLATTLDMRQMVSLVNHAIQNAFSADTYYVGQLNGDKLQMELFYDDGDFFPAMEIALKGTLAGIVVESGDSLLVRDLPAERKKRDLPYIIVGRPRISASWMGTPLIIKNRIAGLIGVASYEKNAFDEDDLELLENIAQQAALTLDNAERHAEVETRSQHDSLTGVLNHNAFLTRFERQAREAIASHNPLSLIMIDIDHFKKVNDQYGHLTGDEVLTNLCHVIRRITKKADLIGRWGGEEFVLSLPNANGPQAYQVADRIRTTLEKILITDRKGNAIAIPTISQGIGVFLEETSDFMQLVDLADQRLYIAKGRGRNEIEPSLQALEETQPQPFAVAATD